jgi:hypothetical protein
MQGKEKQMGKTVKQKHQQQLPKETKWRSERKKLMKKWLLRRQRLLKKGERREEKKRKGNRMRKQLRKSKRKVTRKKEQKKEQRVKMGTKIRTTKRVRMTERYRTILVQAINVNKRNVWMKARRIRKL